MMGYSHLTNNYESSPWTRVACKGGAKYVVRLRVPIVDCVWTDVRSMITQRYSLSPTPIPIYPMGHLKRHLHRAIMGLIVISSHDRCCNGTGRGPLFMGPNGFPCESLLWDIACGTGHPHVATAIFRHGTQRLSIMGHRTCASLWDAATKRHLLMGL